MGIIELLSRMEHLRQRDVLQQAGNRTVIPYLHDSSCSFSVPC